MALSALGPRYDGIIYPVAAQYASRAGLSPDALTALVKAVITQESNGNPTAYHYDAAYEARHGLAPDPVRHASYGLMQVEGSTAAQYGVLDVTRLYDPTVNVNLGTRILVDAILQAHGDLPAAISAYNMGPGGRRPDGTFVNQGYVDAVLGFYADELAAAGASAVGGGGTVQAGVGSGGNLGVILGLSGAALAGYLFLKAMGWVR